MKTVDKSASEYCSRQRLSSEQDGRILTTLQLAKPSSASTMYLTLETLGSHLQFGKGRCHKKSVQAFEVLEKQHKFAGGSEWQTVNIS